MALLTNLLPGLRDLRNPLASGVLWAFALLLAIAPNVDEFKRRLPALAAAVELSRNVEDTASLAGIVFLLYLLGLTGQFVFNLLSRLLRAPLRYLVRYGRRTHQRGTYGTPAAKILYRSFVRSARVRKAMRAISEEAISRAELVRGRILPSELADTFPINAVLADAEATELRLSHENNEQFQQVDRSRAESEFRFLVSVPLLVIIVLLGRDYTLAIALTPIPVILVWQGLASLRRANDLLWTSAYLGYCDPPLLTAAKSAFERWRARLEDWERMESVERDDLIDNWTARYLSRSGVPYQISHDFTSQLVATRESRGVSIEYGSTPSGSWDKNERRVDR